MKINEEIFSLNRIGLKSRLWVAFTLATFAPIALIFYYVMNSYKISVLAVYVLISVVLTGWWFVFEAFSSVIKIYNKTQSALRLIEEQNRVSGGNVKNEIESLDAVFSTLSFRAEESMKELKAAESKMEELNKAIDQKVKVLSSVLDTSVLFSKGVSSDEILQFLAGRLKEIIQAKAVAVLFKKEGQAGEIKFYYGTNKAYPFKGIETSIPADSSIENLIDENSAGKLIEKAKDMVLIDSEHKDSIFAPLLKMFGTGSLVINPIYLEGDAVGFVVAGRSDVRFDLSDETRNIIRLFSHNMGIVWERQMLYDRVNNLEINDPLTGLYNSKFFFTRLNEEIKRSAEYQRPCGLIVVEIANYSEYKKKADSSDLEKTLKRIVRVFRENVRPVDILGRIEENRFGIVVIERSKRQSNYVGMRLKEAVYNLLEKAIAVPPVINIAVAESPVDGTDAAQLLECIQRQYKSNGT